MEEWRDIPHFPGYSVSSKGRVSGPRRPLLTLVKQDGYLKVTLIREDGKHVDKRVNRLVAEAFIPNPYNLPIVMHGDNDRTNNNVWNLSWGTYAENNQYMHDCGRHPLTLTDEDREKAYQVRRTAVIAIDTRTSERIRFISQHDAARALGVMPQHIWGVLNGYRRSTGGYRFEYADKEMDGY